MLRPIPILLLDSVCSFPSRKPIVGRSLQPSFWWLLHQRSYCFADAQHVSRAEVLNVSVRIAACCNRPYSGFT